jgi:hypothetical protein
MAPCALDALLERHRIAREENRWLVAALCAELWNPHLSADDRLTASDFMPGAAERREQEHRDFIEKVQRGEKFEVDQDEVANFRRRMMEAFSDVPGPGVTNIGPSGKPETIRA